MIDGRRLLQGMQLISRGASHGWVAVHSALRDFVWADLRKGTMTFAGLDQHTRNLARFGFVLLAILIAAILFGDFWREHSQLVVLGTESPRGQLAPRLLVPLTLFMLSTAWSFALTGALHSHVAIRLTALAAYVLYAAGWINSILSVGNPIAWERWGALGALLGVALLFILRWRSAPAPRYEFPIVLSLVSAIFLIAQHHELRSLNTYGVPIAFAKISVNLAYLKGMVSPLLLLIGVDIAEFTRRAAHWTTNIVLERTPNFMLGTCLAGLMAWCSYTAAAELLAYKAESSTIEHSLAYVGALIEVGLVIGVFALVLRLDRGRSIPSERAVARSASQSILPLVFLYSAIPLISFFLLGIAMAIPSAPRFADLQYQLLKGVDFLAGTVADPWLLLLSLAAVGAGLLLAGQGKASIALYLGIFGVLEIWERFTEPDALLGRLHWNTQAPVAFWWLVVIALAIGWAVRNRSLTRPRQAQLLFVLLVVTLMRQRDFIENPFSLVFGFAGVGFIAFALVWDLATRGAWTNQGTPSQPRSSRIFIYLGYVLLAATVVCWAVVSHDLDSIQKLTGGYALVGFDRFGKPLIYAVFLVILFGRRSALARSARPAVTQPVFS